eukprot:jgi/Pico_ML_1/53184/g3782.t1
MRGRCSIATKACERVAVTQKEIRDLDVRQESSIQIYSHQVHKPFLTGSGGSEGKRGWSPGRSPSFSKFPWMLP